MNLHAAVSLVFDELADIDPADGWDLPIAVYDTIHALGVTVDVHDDPHSLVLIDDETGARTRVGFDQADRPTVWP